MKVFMDDCLTLSLAAAVRLSRICIAIEGRLTSNTDEHLNIIHEYSYFKEWKDRGVNGRPSRDPGWGGGYTMQGNDP